MRRGETKNEGERRNKKEMRRGVKWVWAVVHDPMLCRNVRGQENSCFKSAWECMVARDDAKEKCASVGWAHITWSNVQVGF